MNKTLVSALGTVVYLLVVVHFLASNYVRVIGPHYTLPANTSAANQDASLMCAETLTDESRGFPIATNNPCGGKSDDFRIAIVLNGLYLALATIIVGGLALRDEPTQLPK